MHNTELGLLKITYLNEAFRCPETLNLYYLKNNACHYSYKELILSNIHRLHSLWDPRQSQFSNLGLGIFEWQPRRLDRFAERKLAGIN